MVSVDQTMKSLVGRTLYECPSNEHKRKYPEIYTELPVYFDGVSAEGLKVPNSGLVSFFGASSTYALNMNGPPKLVILGATTDLKPSPPGTGYSNNSIEITLRVKDVASGWTASLVQQVDKAHLTKPEMLYHDDIADAESFTSRPATFPHIGATEAEARCYLGGPISTNSEEASGLEQWVYAHSLYLYIKHGRVVNVQDSY
jgi:hypothetical protein